MIWSLSSHSTATSSTVWQSLLEVCTCPLYKRRNTYMCVPPSIGFLYTGDILHDQLHRTQFIAPLQADFNPTITDNAKVLVLSTGKWENICVHVLNSPFTVYLHVFTYCFAEITRVRRSYMYICSMCIIFLPYGLWLVLWENMSSAKCENIIKNTHVQFQYMCLYTLSELFLQYISVTKKEILCGFHITTLHGTITLSLCRW